jgi:tRNA threonylcarbamoyl adenosine modification protein (Sua5/YciO/YrdC/YwlC family)
MGVIVDFHAHDSYLVITIASVHAPPGPPSMAQFLSVHPTHPQPRLVRRAAEILAAGGVIAYPTDSSYALGCRIGDLDAVRRIRALRGIDDRHHLTLLCRDMADVGRYAHVDNWQFRMLRQAAPGPYTFLLPATREVPRQFKHAKRHTIGVRIPSHPFVRALLAELGEPMVSSTLIPPGDSVALPDADAVRARYEHELDAVVDAGPCTTDLTTVVDLSQPPATVVRHGAGNVAALGIGEASATELG